MSHDFFSLPGMFFPGQTRVFKEELGDLKGTQAKIHVNPEAQSHYHSAQSHSHCSFRTQDKGGAELEHLERERIITPFQFLDCALPIVLVGKSDGSIRIYGDYTG